MEEKYSRRLKSGRCIQPISRIIAVLIVVVVVTSSVAMASHTLNLVSSHGVKEGTVVGLGTDSEDNMWLVDYDGGNLSEYDQNMNRVSNYDISGDLGTQYAEALSVGPNGNVYVMDRDGDEVFEYKQDGTYVTTHTISTNSQSYGMDWGPNGNYVYVGDTYGTIYKFDSNFNKVSSVNTSGTGSITRAKGLIVTSNENFYIANDEENNFTKWDSSGTLLENHATKGDGDGAIGVPGSNNWYVAGVGEISEYEGPAQKYELSGEVTDSNNEELSNANITVKNQSGSTVATDTTDHLGKYSVQVENGTYNVTASKTDYTEETKEVTINGSGETANFKIEKFNQSIQLDVRMYMEHGQTSPYEVVVSVDGDRRDVTGESNVTSGDTSVVTIDSAAHEVIATNNTSINKRTFVRAQWTDSNGNTYTAERNVTVANATVENIQILPTFTRFSASISDETLMVIIIATGFGAAASLFSTSFAGIAAMTMLMLLGWLAGYVHNGMAIVTVLTAMFVGMNVAGNVDYTVRRQ